MPRLLAFLLLAASASIELSPASSLRCDRIPDVEPPPRWLDAGECMADVVDAPASTARQLTWRALLEARDRLNDPGAAARARSVLRSLQEMTQAASIESARGRARPWIDELRAWVASDPVVAAFRSELKRQLDDEIALRIAAIECPDGFATSPHAADLLAIERTAAQVVLQDCYRDRLLAAFDEATAFDS